MKKITLFLIYVSLLLFPAVVLADLHCPRPEQIEVTPHWWHAKVDGELANDFFSE